MVELIDTRDFCYIDNVIQANILGATFNDNTINEDDSHNAKLHEVFNIAYGERTTLNELFNNLKNIIIKKYRYEKHKTYL